MKRLVVLVPLILAAATAAAEFSFKAQDIKTPVFDEAGHLLRRLSAASASGPIDSPQFANGKVEFFAASSQEKPSAVLAFDQANYTKLSELMSGDGVVRLTSTDGSVTGIGYECGLATGILKLRSSVQYVSQQGQLTGDTAEIHFDPKTSAKATTIREVVMDGNVVMVREPTAQAAFDRAETSYARYNANEQKIYLRKPVTLWKKGEKALIEVKSDYVEIDLKR